MIIRSDNVDRQVIGILAPTLQKEIGWNEIDYGYIVTAFTAAYALGMLIIGRLIDNFGTKKGYTFALTGWSFAAIGHALATSALGFGVARFALGLFEAGNFPAAIKTVAEWFPKELLQLEFLMQVQMLGRWLHLLWFPG